MTSLAWRGAASSGAWGRPAQVMAPGKEQGHRQDGERRAEVSSGQERDTTGGGERNPGPHSNPAGASRRERGWEGLGGPGLVVSQQAGFR